MVLLETESQLERRAGEELLGKNICTHRELCADVETHCEYTVNIVNLVDVEGKKGRCSIALQLRNEWK